MKPENLNLELLMEQALAGDNQAYTTVLTEIAKILRPYLGKRLNQNSEVEDVLQEILLSIHKARHTYNCKRPLKPWVFAIAKFRLSDFLRAHYASQLQYTDNLDAAQNIEVENVTEPGLSYESIKKDIFKLPGKQPMILHLIHNEGYTMKEVAKKMCMTESAVKVSAHRAYKVLRKKLSNG